MISYVHCDRSHPLLPGRVTPAELSRLAETCSRILTRPMDHAEARPIVNAILRDMGTLVAKFRRWGFTTGEIDEYARTPSGHAGPRKWLERQRGRPLPTLQVEHGTAQCYRLGCRQPECREAQMDRQRDYRRRRTA